MLKQVKLNGEFELRAYEFVAGHKTYRLAEKRYGTWEVMSWATSKPTARVFWGFKSFSSLAEVESHYKSLRGISKLIEERGK